MHQPTAPSAGWAPEARRVLTALRADRVLAVVRAASLVDAQGLCASLVDGGIRVVELTFTIPDLARHLTVATRSAAQCGALVGAGTVRTAGHARVAVDAGAQFLVTPGLGEASAEIVQIGHAAGAAVVLGALTPSEVLSAIQQGADAVKIFPARLGGPQLFTDLRGPFPDAHLLPSGGVTADNAQAYLDAGALAVSAGTSVVPPTAVQSSDWASITDSAKKFCAALSSTT